MDLSRDAACRSFLIPVDAPPGDATTPSGASPGCSSLPPALALDNGTEARINLSSPTGGCGLYGVTMECVEPQVIADVESALHRELLSCHQTVPAKAPATQRLVHRPDPATSPVAVAERQVAVAERVLEGLAVDRAIQLQRMRRNETTTRGECTCARARQPLTGIVRRPHAVYIGPSASIPPRAAPEPESPLGGAGGSPGLRHESASGAGEKPGGTDEAIRRGGGVPDAQRTACQDKPTWSALKLPEIKSCTELHTRWLHGKKDTAGVLVHLPIATLAARVSERRISQAGSFQPWLHGGQSTSKCGARCSVLGGKGRSRHFTGLLSSGRSIESCQRAGHRAGRGSRSRLKLFQVLFLLKMTNDRTGRVCDGTASTTAMPHLKNASQVAIRYPLGQGYGK